MDIPRYWAEHKVRVRVGKRNLSLRRFGWSNDSHAAAEHHAAERTAVAAEELRTGGAPARFELKVAYGGVHGLPIREEIISEHPEVGAVITRNAYGALCLNVSNVLFADIDIGSPEWARARLRSCLFTIVAFLVLAGFIFASAKTTMGYSCAGLLGISTLLLSRRAIYWRRRLQFAEDPDRALRPVERFVADHPHWLIHVYRTPAGLRLLATHAVFDPRSPDTEKFFRAVDVDPVFAKMCKLQDCFRARVSAKPWRIGITSRMGYSVWPPPDPLALKRREQWVSAYNSRAQGFAACRHLAVLGAASEQERARATRLLHDELSRSNSRLPLA